MAYTTSSKFSPDAIGSIATFLEKDARKATSIVSKTFNAAAYPYDTVARRIGYLKYQWRPVNIMDEKICYRTEYPALSARIIELLVRLTQDGIFQIGGSFASNFLRTIRRCSRGPCTYSPNVVLPFQEAKFPSDIDIYLFGSVEEGLELMEEVMGEFADCVEQVHMSKFDISFNVREARGALTIDIFRFQIILQQKTQTEYFLFTDMSLSGVLMQLLDKYEARVSFTLAADVTARTRVVFVHAETNALTYSRIANKMKKYPSMTFVVVSDNSDPINVISADTTISKVFIRSQGNDKELFSFNVSIPLAEWKVTGESLMPAKMTISQVPDRLKDMLMLPLNIVETYAGSSLEMSHALSGTLRRKVERKETKMIHETIQVYEVRTKSGSYAYYEDRAFISRKAIHLQGYSSPHTLISERNYSEFAERYITYPYHITLDARVFRTALLKLAVSPFFHDVSEIFLGNAGIQIDGDNVSRILDPCVAKRFEHLCRLPSPMVRNINAHMSRIPPIISEFFVFNDYGLHVRCEQRDIPLINRRSIDFIQSDADLQEIARRIVEYETQTDSSIKNVLVGAYPTTYGWLRDPIKIFDDDGKKVKIPLMRSGFDLMCFMIFDALEIATKKYPEWLEIFSQVRILQSFRASRDGDLSGVGHYAMKVENTDDTNGASAVSHMLEMRARDHDDDDDDDSVHDDDSEHGKGWFFDNADDWDDDYEL